MLGLMHTSGRRVFAALGLVSLATVGFLACTDDDFTVDPGPDASATPTPTTPTPTPQPTPELDGGAPDAEVFEEAGTVVIDFDAGDGEEEPDGGPIVDAGDAGPDAAPPPEVCNTLTAAGTVDALCASRATVLTGGALVTGDYSLVSVTVLQQDCTKFQVTTHGGDLTLAVDRTGVGRASYVLTRRPKNVITRPLTSRYTHLLSPGANNTSPALYDYSCPAATVDKKDAYQSVSDPKTGVTQLTFVAPYYNTTARYVWQRSAVVK